MDTNVMWSEEGDLIAFDDAMAYADHFSDSEERDTLADYGFNHETTPSVAMQHEGVMLTFGYELLHDEDQPFNPDYL